LIRRLTDGDAVDRTERPINRSVDWHLCRVFSFCARY